MNKIIISIVLIVFTINCNAQTKKKLPIAKSNVTVKSVKLPFVGTKYFEALYQRVTYAVTIKTDGSTKIIAGGPGANSVTETIYKGKYKSLMGNKNEGIKIEDGFLYLLDESGTIRRDCTYNIEENECLCKFSIKEEILTRQN